MNSLVLAIALVTVGQVLDTRNLSPTQQAELQMKYAELVEKGNSTENIEKVKEWSELGQSVGVALVATAKELGIAVDDFSKTGIGKVTIAVIVWKIMGKEVVRTVISIIYLITGVWLWNHYFRKLCVIKSVTYENGKKSRVEHFNPSDSMDGFRFIMLIVLVLILASGFLLMLL
jgi:hypothetical protein